MEANQNSGATTTDGAAKRLSALMNPSEPTPPTDPEAQPEGTETEAEVETPEGDTKPEPKYKVPHKGEEVELTLEELIKGNMFEADYRHKTTDLSEQRKALEAKEKQVDDQLNDARLLIEEEVGAFDTPEMKTLEHDDPEAYLKEWRRVQRKVERFNKRKAEREEQLNVKRQDLTAKEREAMLRAIPDWLDEKKMAAEAPEVIKSLKAHGYSDQDLPDIVDHRIMVLARKAFLFDQIHAQKPGDKKVVVAPRVAKPGVSQSAEGIASKHVLDARQRLKQSGTRQDAVNAMKALLKS